MAIFLRLIQVETFPSPPCMIVYHQVPEAAETVSHLGYFLDSKTTTSTLHLHFTGSRYRAEQFVSPDKIRWRYLKVSTIPTTHRKAPRIIFHTSQTVGLRSAVKVTALFSVNYTHWLYSNTTSSQVVSQDCITNPTTGKNPLIHLTEINIVKEGSSCLFFLKCLPSKSKIKLSVLLGERQKNKN